MVWRGCERDCEMPDLELGGKRGLSTNQTSTRELSLDASLVCFHCLLVLNVARKPVEHGSENASSDVQLTRIQSGRLGPHPRHSIVSRKHVLHESPSRCSSHFYGQWVS